MSAFRGPVLALLAALMACVSGCAKLDELRTEFVALRYVQSATAQVTGLPMQRAKAVRALDRALELAPDHPTVKRRAGVLYVAARAYDKALPLLEETAKTDDPRRKMLHAQCLLNTGEVERGTAICRKQLAQAAALRRGKSMNRLEYAVILNDAGYILADANVEVTRAAAAIKAALKLVPLDASITDSMGWVFFREGRMKDAAFYLERAVRLAGREHPEVLYHLGATYARLGRIADSERALKRALELDPDCDEAKAELRRLGRQLPRPTLARAPAPVPAEGS